MRATSRLPPRAEAGGGGAANIRCKYASRVRVGVRPAGSDARFHARRHKQTPRGEDGRLPAPPTHSMVGGHLIRRPQVASYTRVSVEAPPQRAVGGQVGVDLEGSTEIIEETLAKPNL